MREESSDKYFGFVNWYLFLKYPILPLTVISLPIGRIFLTYPSKLLKKIQSISPVSSLHKTLFGKFLTLGKEYFFGIIVIVCTSPILKSLIFEDKDRSVYDFGNFHNKSKILLIFFFLSKLVVFIPTPFSAVKSDNKYL